MRRALPFFLLLAISAPVLAQGSGSSGSQGGIGIPMSADAIARAAQDALDLAKGAASDSLLIKDLLGRTVTGPDGTEIGTVENFMVVPGGRIVAAVLQTSGGESRRIAVPFSLVKLSGTADKLSLQATLQELQNMPAIQSLTAALPTGSGASQ